jgi:predicted phage tail protein
MADKNILHFFGLHTTAEVKALQSLLLEREATIRAREAVMADFEKAVAAQLREREAELEHVQTLLQDREATIREREAEKADYEKTVAALLQEREAAVLEREQKLIAQGEEQQRARAKIARLEAELAQPANTTAAPGSLEARLKQREAEIARLMTINLELHQRISQASRGT